MFLIVGNAGIISSSVTMNEGSEKKSRPPKPTFKWMSHIHKASIEPFLTAPEALPKLHITQFCNKRSKTLPKFIESSLVSFEVPRPGAHGHFPRQQCPELGAGMELSGIWVQGFFLGLGFRV